MSYYRSVAVALVQRPDIPAFTAALRSDASPSFTPKGNMTAATKAIVKKYPAAYIEGFEPTGDAAAFRVMVGGLPVPDKPGAPAPQPTLKQPARLDLATLRFSFDDVK